MILEKIKNFNWYNEPKNVRFIEAGLLIETFSQTDFWQCLDYNFSKDDGHLFAEECFGDFVLTVKWSFRQLIDSAQCGAMVRYDEHNWIKAGVLTIDPKRLQVGVVVSNNGSCDWSIVNIADKQNYIWIKIRRKGRDFIVYYSCDGECFEQVRILHLPNINELLNIGAYACSPKKDSFECVLEEIYITPY